MKKLLIILFLFFSVSLLAQPVTNNNGNGNNGINGADNGNKNGWCNPHNVHYDPAKCENLVNTPIDSYIMILMICGAILGVYGIVKSKKK